MVVEVKKMKNKIVWGSVLVALLMLVSTQIVFIESVRSSDPTAHEGDADAGDLWIDNLDVSSELRTMDYIGIGHADATDDWVIWDDGSGNINASWDVDIGPGTHPEYYVLICMVIYNIDDNNNEIGNDTFTKTYNANTPYDESGTLSVAVSFTQQQQQAGSQTLVCYMSACAMINDTTEAKNFTSWGHDRCVIAVDFTDPTQPLFPTYREEANENFPSMWSYCEGWDEGGRFTNEDDMLQNLTFYTVKGNAGDESSYSWKIGVLDFHFAIFGGMNDETIFNGMNYKKTMKWDAQGKIVVEIFSTIDYYKHNAILPISYQIQIDEGTGQSQTLDEVEGYYWEGSCAYFNDTHSLSVSNSTSSGVTTVNVDISDVLGSDEEFIYTFAGENGETRIQITCN